MKRWLVIVLWFLALHAQAVQVADGVIQGASVVRRLMEGGPDAVYAYVAEVRHALDGVRSGV